jgi:hypothetical protein
MNLTGNRNDKERNEFYLTKLLTDKIVLRRRKINKLMTHGWNDNGRGKPQYWGETSVSATLSNRDPNMGSKPGLRDDRPATDSLSWRTRDRNVIAWPNIIWATWGISRKASVKVVNAQAEFRTKHSWIQVRRITAWTYILGSLYSSNIFKQ